MIRDHVEPIPDHAGQASHRGGQIPLHAPALASPAPATPDPDKTVTPLARDVAHRVLSLPRSHTTSAFMLPHLPTAPSRSLSYRLPATFRALSCLSAALVEGQRGGRVRCWGFQRRDAAERERHVWR